MDLNLLLWNMDGDKGVEAGERYDIAKSKIDDLTKKEPGLFILAQEIKTKKLHKLFNTFTPRNEHAAIYPLFKKDEEKDEEGDDVEFIDIAELTTVNDSIQYSGEAFGIGRLQAGVVVKRNLLLVSWHGINEGKKINEESREMRFLQMIEFVKKLQKTRKCSTVVIGGDFNFEFTTASDCLHKMTDISARAILGYVQPEDRKHEYDYLVVWPSTHVQLRGDGVSLIETDREKGKRPFDHPLVQYILLFTPPEE